jgi:hypothetical protein
MTKQEFNRVRLAFLDNLRRDVRLTPTARLIGLEIGGYLNSTSEEAWPSHTTLMRTLGLGLGTIKRGVQELAAYRYYTVQRRAVRNGRKNFYRALFDEVQTNLGPTWASMAGTKTGGNTDQSKSGVGTKNDPQSPSRNSSKFPSSNGGADDHVSTTSTAVDLFNQLLAILGIDLFGQRNDADQSARRRAEIIWIGEQLALFDRVFEDHPPGMDGRRFIISVAEEVKRKLKPNTVVRTVRYLEPARARRYQELAGLREQARRTA